MSRADTPRRVLASFLIATGLLVAVLPGVATADNTDVSGDGVQSGPGGAVIKDGQNLVKAAGGCALIVQGGKTVSAGDCSGGSASRPPATTPTPKAPTDHSPSKTTATTPPDPKTASTGVSTPAPDTRTTTSLTNGTTSGRGKTEDQLCPSGPPKDALKAKVGRAVDGDTLQLDRKIDGKDRVRLIGVDTPELHGKNGDPEPYAEAAANFASDQLKGKDVLLVPGKDNTDDYHRLLAYVWTTPGDGVIGTVKGMLGGGPTLFNRTLVDKGYAKVMTIPPNDRYATCFEAAERSARSAGEGRWGTSSSTMGATTVTNLDPTATTMSRTSATAGPTATSQQGPNSAPTTSSTVVKPQEATSLGRTSSPTTPLTSATTNGGTSTTPSTIPEATTSTPSPTATTVSASTSEQETQPVPTPRVEPLVAPQPTTQVDQPAPTSQPQPLPDTWPPPASQSQPVATPSTIPYQSLPQSTTPMGETQRLLPDTGGRSPVFLLVGAALVGAGLLIWRGRPDEHSGR